MKQGSLSGELCICEPKRKRRRGLFIALREQDQGGKPQGGVAGLFGLFQCNERGWCACKDGHRGGVGIPGQLLQAGALALAPPRRQLQGGAGRLAAPCVFFGAWGISFFERARARCERARRGTDDGAHYCVRAGSNQRERCAQKAASTQSCEHTHRVLAWGRGSAAEQFMRQNGLCGVFWAGGLRPPVAGRELALLRVLRAGARRSDAGRA